MCKTLHGARNQWPLVSMGNKLRCSRIVRRIQRRSLVDSLSKSHSSNFMTRLARGAQPTKVTCLHTRPICKGHEALM